MSNAALWIMILIGVFCIMAATRPERPDRSRRIDYGRRAKPAFESRDEAGTQSDDTPNHANAGVPRLRRFPVSLTLSDAATGFATVQLLASGRNRWNRVDLERGIGPDHVVAESALALWPANRDLLR
jgi:hypothetical protein